MREYSYVPATILNIGVGSTPELAIWKRHLPDATIVGIDPKHKRQKPYEHYTRAAIGDGSVDVVQYCKLCRSVKCVYPEKHADTKCITSVPSITIDALARNHDPPFFLWIDIEGSEAEALAGAGKTCQYTRFINIEMTSHPVWDNRTNTKAMLASNGYELCVDHKETEDMLYIKGDWDVARVGQA